MVDMDGKYHWFDKSELADLRIDTKSLMPDDFGKRLTSGEIQNVVAYLKTLDGSDISKVGMSGGLTWERMRDSAKEPQNYTTYWGDLKGTHMRRSIRSIRPT